LRTRVRLSITSPQIGRLLREWRERRRRTQFDLALEAGISARHLSFVETGRARPGAEIILRLAEQLEVPLRERNRLLLAAGHAPAFPERPLDDPELAAVKDALTQILTKHEPYPAMVIDRRWNLVAGNSALGLLAGMIDRDLLDPPVNVMRVGLHPRGLGRHIVNLGAVRGYFLGRLAHQVAITADPELAALLEEVTDYNTPQDESRSGRDGSPTLIQMRTPDGTNLAFLGMFATFDTPFDVTISELAIELAFPADQVTADFLRSPAARSRPR
jgi:transcriptional regulator with XRE-family HTH domain